MSWVPAVDVTRVVSVFGTVTIAYMLIRAHGAAACEDAQGSRRG